MRTSMSVCPSGCFTLKTSRDTSKHSKEVHRVQQLSLCSIAVGRLRKGLSILSTLHDAS